MITPSVGRKVWFYADDKQAEPWDATVIKVHAPALLATPFTKINLLAIDPEDGSGHFYEGVTCSPTRVDYPHFTWMPHQMEQAGKYTSYGPAQKVADYVGNLCSPER